MTNRPVPIRPRSRPVSGRVPPTLSWPALAVSIVACACSSVERGDILLRRGLFPECGFDFGDPARRILGIPGRDALRELDPQRLAGVAEFSNLRVQGIEPTQGFGELFDGVPLRVDSERHLISRCVLMALTPRRDDRQMPANPGLQTAPSHLCLLGRRIIVRIAISAALGPKTSSRSRWPSRATRDAALICDNRRQIVEAEFDLNQR